MISHKSDGAYSILNCPSDSLIGVDRSLMRIIKKALSKYIHSSIDAQIAQGNFQVTNCKDAIYKQKMA